MHKRSENELKVGLEFQDRSQFHNLPIHNTCTDLDISVIVPVYNAENFIEQCAESILNQQSNFAWEIIFVNDGSTDDSRNTLQKVIKKWQAENTYKNSKHKPDIHLIEQANQGAAVARNNGIRESRGKYLAFIDSDDFLNSSSYLLDMFCAIQQADADICQEGYVQLINNKQVITEWSPEWNYSEDYKDFYKLPGYFWGKLIRKSLFDGVCIPEGRAFEDTIIQMILFPRCKKFCLIPNADYVYRLNPDSVTYQKNKNNRGVDAVLVMDDLLAMINTIHLKTNAFWYEAFIHHFGLILFTRIRHCDPVIMKKAYLLSCDLQDEAANMTGISYFRPFDGQDFAAQHRLFIWWYCRCVCHKLIEKSQKECEKLLKR